MSGESDIVGSRGEIRTKEPTAAERTIARRSAEVRATVPDLELSAEVDVSDLPHDVWLTPLLVQACAVALRAVPYANGVYRDGRFELYSRVNVGVVLARDGHHLTPTVFDADTKSLRELSDEIRDLTERATDAALTARALSGATFTLWNAGELGVDRGGILIGPSQVAALAAGSVRDVPVVREGTVQPGRAMTITLACDHRMLYGARAAAFLGAVKSALATADPR